VVGANEINIRKAQNLMDAFGYVAGVSRREGADKTSDSFMVRGFQAGAGSGSMYRDGKKYMVNGYDGSQEPYGLERIELLKGAASLLYGASAPGGIINTISKRPTQETIAEIGLELGNYNRKQLTADFSGSITENSDWSYRLTLLERDSDSFIDFVPDDKTYIAPALMWQPTEDTTITLLSHYQKIITDYVYGLPVEGTLLPNPNGQIPANRFTGVPDKDNYESENISVGYIVDHRFSEQLSLHHSFNYFSSDYEISYTWIWGLQENKRQSLERAFAERNDETSLITADTYLNYSFNTSNIKHQLTFGFDVTLIDYQSQHFSRTLNNIDLFNPVYNSPIGERVDEGYSSKSQTDRLGIYLQDQIKINDKWIVAVGLRQELFENQESPFYGAEVWEKEDTDALTGNAGLVYLADNGFAPFISYSQSFELQSGKDRHNKRFNPTEGEQLESGVRYQPNSENWLLSASIYQLKQTNVTTQEPGYPDHEIQTGEVTSKGFELEFKGRLTDDLQIISAYAYTDARTTKTNTPEDINKRTGAVPYNQFSLWADYKFNPFNLPSLTVGAGARYVGETKGVWSDGDAPAFTLIDAMVSYETKHWRYALNVSNLTDKTYIASCTYDCFYGEGRKIIASVNYNF
jgi:iron complex outermembrane receptor protein